MGNILRYIVVFVVLVLLQGLVIKNIKFGSVLGMPIEIFVWPLFLLFVRINENVPLVLTMAFMAGLTIDLFYQTPGLHAGAAVAAAYARRFVLLWLEPRTGYPSDILPIALDNRRWFFILLACVTGVYCLGHYILLIFSAREVLEILLRTLLTGSISLICCTMIALIVKAVNR